ncbi:MAG: HDIG domain-containing protein [Sulfolobales archaeon]|nr:HDIG domain-containing protein [Sulfolobales archaeon]
MRVISRSEALELLGRYLKDEKIVKHCLAVGAIMKVLGRRLGEDENLWELVGLLHDVDYDYVGRDMSKHGLGALQILEGVLPHVALEAIASHNEHNGFKPTSEEAVKLSHALRASDHLAGFIVATALVMPSRKLAEVRLDTLARKFKSKDFARGVSRSRIGEVERLGVKLEEFLDLGLEALKEIDRELGL